MLGVMPTRKPLLNRPPLNRNPYSVALLRARRDQRARRLVADQLALERAPHLLELRRHLVLELLRLALERAHAAAHAVELVLQLEHLLDAGEVHAELGR